MSHYARRLADLINEQATDVLKEYKSCIPASAISTLQYLSSHDNVTVALLANDLGVTHQMATQRINALEKLLLVKRISLPTDQRAKQIQLSKKGYKEIKALQPFMRKMTLLFTEFESELGHKLSQTIYQAELSLRQTPLKERIKVNGTDHKI